MQGMSCRLPVGSRGAAPALSLRLHLEWILPSAVAGMGSLFEGGEGPLALGERVFGFGARFRLRIQIRLRPIGEGI